MRPGCSVFTRQPSQGDCNGPKQAHKGPRGHERTILDRFCDDPEVRVRVDGPRRQGPPLPGALTPPNEVGDRRVRRVRHGEHAVDVDGGEIGLVSADAVVSQGGQGSQSEGGQGERDGPEKRLHGDDSRFLGPISDLGKEPRSSWPPMIPIADSEPVSIVKPEPPVAAGPGSGSEARTTTPLGTHCRARSDVGRGMWRGGMSRIGSRPLEPTTIRSRVGRTSQPFTTGSKRTNA
jgi:hypothetical protein